MIKTIKTIITLFCLLLSPPVCWAVDYYLSPTGSDAGDGSIDNPWKSLDYALDPRMNGAGVEARVDGGDGIQDILYLRGGVYNLSTMDKYDPLEDGPVIYPNNTDANDATVTIKSYPGEWAILDATGLDRGFRIRRAIWNVVFENFEIRNADRYGIDAKRDGGLDAPMLNSCVFRNLYIHDNDNNDDEGGNPAGMMLSMQDSIVEYCSLINNGSQYNTMHNAANLAIMFYYSPVAGATSAYPRKNNIIRYCIFEGANSGIKNKGPGFFKDTATNCGGSNAIIDEHPEWANEIHHNVFRNQKGSALYLTNDYLKFHHNLIENSGYSAIYSPELDACQAVYKPEFYNNTFINSYQDFQLELILFPGGYNFDIYNNMIIDPAADSLSLYVGGSSTWPITEDHNGFDSGETTIVSYADSGLLSLAQWQGLGFATGSLHQTLTLESDYTLPSSSPAIAAGRNGEDLGAFPAGVSSWIGGAGYTSTMYHGRMGASGSVSMH